MTRRREFLTLTAGLSASAVAGLPLTAHAQTMELAKIMVGFPPGGTSDALSRRIADKSRDIYATNVVVENRPGAGSQIAITTLRDSVADGSVLLVAPSSALAIYPFTYPKLPYKPLEDLQPVSLAATFSHGFGVGSMVPASVKDFKGFLAWVRANPDKGNYGSPAAGSMPHMVAALASVTSGVPLTHVAYRGSAPGMADLMGGQIAGMSAPLGEFLPFVKSGRVRVLAVSGAARSPFLPDVATFQQQGLPITTREWWGLFLPGKANAQTVQRANAALKQALAQPDLIASMAELGMEVHSSTPQELAALLKADMEEWRVLIKKIGFTMES